MQRKNLETRLLTYAAVPAFAFCGATKAQAGTINGFTGPYDPANWTFANNPSGTGGSVNTSGAPASILLTSGNVSVGGQTNLTITAVGTGTWSFDWSYTTGDFSGAKYDPAGWLVNGAFTLLTPNECVTCSGGVSTTVNAGDVIGFRISTNDGILGSGRMTVSNFAAPSDEVPEPSTLSLMALGVAGLLIARARRKRA